MKHKLKHIARYLSLLIAVAVLGPTCKSRIQEIPPVITLSLDVKDENKNLVSEANLYLYNDLKAFEAAYKNSISQIYNSAGSYLTKKVINGHVDIQNLPSNSPYWLLVHNNTTFFIDGVSATIERIDKDNSEAYYTLDGFQNGSEIKATVYIQPVTSLVKITTPSGTFPNIVFNNGAPEVLPVTGYKKFRKGTVGYQARSNDCVWTGSIEAEGGKVVSHNLGNCTSLVYTFIPPNDYKPGEIIKIYIGQNKNDTKNPALVLNSAASQSIVLANGRNYTYFAESSTRKCVWEGAVSPSNKLADCQSALITLSSINISNITTIGATAGGNISADGGDPVTARGVVWGTSPNPTTASDAVTVTDIDGYTYPTVTIGTQVWMAENLRTTKYSDGTTILLVTNTSGPSTPAMFWYNNDQATYTANKYGALYNWYAVSPTTNGGKNLCPTGWHVPTDAEWTTLSDYLGGESVAGGKMKTTGTTQWLSPNTEATNSSGFSGLPGGNRISNGTFLNIGNFGFWWSSSEYDTYYAWLRNLRYDYGSVNRTYGYKEDGLSVRCLRD